MVLPARPAWDKYVAHSTPNEFRVSLCLSCICTTYTHKRLLDTLLANTPTSPHGTHATVKMAQVNGETPQHPINSLFLDVSTSKPPTVPSHQKLTLEQHLLAYPVIKDGMTTVKKNQLAQRSIQLSDTAYRTLAGPVIPFLTRPYQYVSPYIERADQLGDKTLTTVDERFPLIKKPTGEIYADARSLVLLPYHTGLQGKEHVLGVYSAECKKLGGESLLVYSKALVGTVFAISGETLDWFSAYLAARKGDAKDMANEKVNN